MGLFVFTDILSWYFSLGLWDFTFLVNGFKIFFLHTISVHIYTEEILANSPTEKF